jgi:hypothetical protein
MAWLAQPVYLAGCAHEPDMRVASDRQQTPCHSGETFSCVERLGKPMHCFCADKDALRELLDPK